MEEKRLPSPQSVRSLIQQLKNGVDPDQQETIEELLESARARVLEAIPQEALAVLSQISPQLLESYALLHQEVTVRVKAESTREETHGDQKSPAKQAQRPPAVAQKARSVTFDDMEESGLRVTMTAENSEEQAFLDALTGLENEGLPLSQVQRGQSLYVPPPVTSTMQLDSFQGSYKGYVEVTEKTTRTIAVHKALFEEEQTRQGGQVKEPSYWLPRYNAMTVYFTGEPCYETDFVLGSRPTQPDVPAGARPTPEQLVSFFNDPYDEEYEIEAIKLYLRTPEQKTWLDQNDTTISDVLNGRTLISLDVEGMLFNDWNAKLGVKVFGF